MKKILLFGTIIFASVGVQAATIKAASNEATVSIMQDNYTEIASETVPAPVQTALSKAYPNAKLDKAYVNDKKEYKLEISVDDQKATVYADVDGNWIKI